MTKDIGNVELAPVETPERLRLIQIAEWLERGGDEHQGRKTVFDMDHWLTHNWCVWRYSEDGMEVAGECGTACCIGGATQFFNLEHYTNDDELWPAVSARLLGLDTDAATKLFYQFPDGVEAHQAAKVVRHLLATGEVDWEKAYD